jgi:hypothetical protein
MPKKRRSASVKRPARSKPKKPARSKPKKKVREVDGVFLDREHLNRALSALKAAGFGPDRMTAALERHEGGRRIPVTDLPPAGFTQADKRQLRTLATGLTGAIAALAAFGVTIGTGGAAAAAVAAATLAGGSAATGVQVFKTMQGFDGVAEDVILSVRVEDPDDEERIVKIFQKHDAKQIWAQNRPYRISLVAAHPPA